MARSERASSPPLIVASAEDALVASLRPLLPHARLHQSSLGLLLSDAARLRPAVVLCMADDAAAGLSVLRRLRAVGAGERILFLTPVAAATERLEALEAGVDDAIAAPVAATELAGRLSLLLRRVQAVGSDRLTVGDGVELDPDRRELIRDGRRIHLRPKEAGLLELLARSPGRTLTRPRILDRVWGPEHRGDPRTVDVHVRWLRAKIEVDPRRPERLLTVRGVGYRLEPGALTQR